MSETPEIQADSVAKNAATPVVLFSTPRWLITTMVGFGVVLLGVLLFFNSKSLAAPPGRNADNTRSKAIFSVSVSGPEEVSLREAIWAGFGSAVTLGGFVVVAAGLSAWCRCDGGR
jgi:hypothetical protein